MDHLKWDGAVVDSYLSSLKKMSRCLDSEIQNLEAARKTILRQQVTSDDEALMAISHKLEKEMKKIINANDKIQRLWNALNACSENFSSVERRIANMGTDLIYVKVSQRVSEGGMSPAYIPYTGMFSKSEITPDWLVQLAEEDAAVFA